MLYDAYGRKVRRSIGFVREIVVIHEPRRKPEESVDAVGFLLPVDDDEEDDGDEADDDGVSPEFTPIGRERKRV